MHRKKIQFQIGGFNAFSFRRSQQLAFLAIHRWARANTSLFLIIILGNLVVILGWFGANFLSALHHYGGSIYLRIVFSALVLHGAPFSLSSRLRVGLSGRNETICVSSAPEPFLIGFSAKIFCIPPACLCKPSCSGFAPHLKRPSMRFVGPKTFLIKHPHPDERARGCDNLSNCAILTQNCEEDRSYGEIRLRCK